MVVIVLGVKTVERKPREETLDDPASRQQDEALGFVGAFDDGQPPSQVFINPCHEFPGVTAVRPDEFDKREQVIELGDDHHRAVTILNACGVNDNAKKIAKRIDGYMAFAAFDFLSRIITARPPFCAVFADWLSIIAAVGVAFFPAFTRTASRKPLLIFSHVPLRLQRCQYPDTFSQFGYSLGNILH